MLAGVAALFALYLNWQRTINDRRRLVNDTYVKAIEQLGHEKREVRLGAIYALERIARDAEDFDLHWSIMETLTAYIRERPAPKPPKETDAKGDSDTTEPSNATDETTVEPSLSPQIPERETPQTDIAAVSTVLKRRSETRADQEANANRRLDVRRADLPGADLSDITLLHADLRGANLTGADLTSADLASADLEHAKFSKHPQELGAIWDEANPPRGLDDIKIETT